MITIPTTELIGSLTDVLPVITDPKGSLAGVRVSWDGESLHFTTYDVHAGATVEWTPGEGAEGDLDAGPDGEDATFEDIDWGGDDAPWSVWIWLPQAKEILKLFKLPAKLWRFPVTLKCSPTGDRLTIEREDGPKAGRLLMLNTDNGMLPKIPDVRALAGSVVLNSAAERGREAISLAPHRLGAVGAIRAHGVLALRFPASESSLPIALHAGTRYAGFIYGAETRNVRPYSILRDGAGVVTSEPKPDADVF